MLKALTALAACLLVGCAAPHAANGDAASSNPEAAPAGLRLGHFSVSLAVKDLAASRDFYEKLGFRVIGGNAAHNWLILQNDTATIGLFQGMFERNMLTFNPGWDRDANTLSDFDDVRTIQGRLKAAGLTLATEADENTTGPASFVIVDPDGNPILIDQHTASPE